MDTVKWVMLGPEGVRSGWRALVWFVATMVLTVIAVVPVAVAGPWLLKGAAVEVVLVLQLVIYAPTFIVTLACSVLLDRQSPRSIGLGGPLARSAIELLCGVGVAAALILITIAGIGAVHAAGLVQGTAFAIGVAPFEVRTLWALPLWFGVLVFAAAWEELFFRGYGFIWAGRLSGNLLRLGLGALGIDRVGLAHIIGRMPVFLASALVFGLVHIGNPGHSGGLALLNTVLAGMWLAVAIYRTRALWHAIGLHFGWNATMGLLMGVPVSGEPVPSLLTTTLDGPVWLAGGDYGLEASVVATATLLVGTGIAAAWPRRRGASAVAALEPVALAAPGRLPETES